jgi:phage terminase large subunit GpA-like protein
MTTEKTTPTKFDDLQKAWLVGRISELVDHIEHQTPVEFNEGARYLPQSVSRFSGYIDYSLTPYWIEILNCFDPDSDAREVSVMKGVQVAYTTALESIMFYVAGHLCTVPCMFATADKDLSRARMENNIIPMFQHSGMNVFESADQEGGSKTGKTQAQLQWKGGGYMIPAGAKNSDRMRSFSIMFLLMDEIDAWPGYLRGGGNPVFLLKDRCAAFWGVRKIMMGSTPVLKGSSHIESEYMRGDQRQYEVRCLKCGFPQALRWSGKDDRGVKFGMAWDYNADGTLDMMSVRYLCRNCQHAHQEHDKPRLFSVDNAAWVPTATPVEPGIRSYKLPAMYSPVGMQPWSKCVSAYLRAWDPNQSRVKDMDAFQLFYNNVLAEPFEVIGEKFNFQRMSAHRRTFYRYGEIPNREIEKFCPSVVQFLAMTVDVHADFLAVLVVGFTVGGNSWTVEYKHITDPVEHGCELIESPCWAEVQRMIDEQEYVADDGRRYRIAITLVDSGYAEKTVSEFCSQWDSGVYPIKGDSYSDKRINNFREMKTSAGANGFLIAADAYKDRMAPILRREWQPEMGDQGQYQFNAPVDMTDLQIKELTREYKREKKMPNGNVKREWYRPQGARNELWDCLMYAEAAFEILALLVCRNNLELTEIDWPTFWSHVEEQQLFFSLD